MIYANFTGSTKLKYVVYQPGLIVPNKNQIGRIVLKPRTLDVLEHNLFKRYVLE